MNLSELHHCLYKKIAQLNNKDIFFLNTKNNEYESDLQSILQALQQEMDQIVNEDKGRRIKSFALTRRNTSIKKFKQRNMQKIIQEKEQGIVTQYEKRIKQIQKETKLLKQKFDYLQKQVNMKEQDDQIQKRLLNNNRQINIIILSEKILNIR